MSECILSFEKNKDFEYQTEHGKIDMSNSQKLAKLKRSFKLVENMINTELRNPDKKWNYPVEEVIKIDNRREGNLSFRWTSTDRPRPLPEKEQWYHRLRKRFARKLLASLGRLKPDSKS